LSTDRVTDAFSLCWSVTSTFFTSMIARLPVDLIESGNRVPPGKKAGAASSLFPFDVVYAAGPVHVNVLSSIFLFFLLIGPSYLQATRLFPPFPTISMGLLRQTDFVFRERARPPFCREAWAPPHSFCRIFSFPPLICRSTPCHSPKTFFRFMRTSVPLSLYSR